MEYQRKTPSDSPLGLKNTPEYPSPIQLDIKGTIPSWLRGVMYRAGAGTFNILLEDGSTYHIKHPFDGLAMLHRFEVNGIENSVSYCSRHTSNGVKRRIIQKDPTLLTFGPDPCKTIFGRMQSVFYHISRMNRYEQDIERDPEFDMVNVTITPNFPIGKTLEDKTGVLPGEAVVVKRDANTLQLVDSKTLEPLKMFTYGHVDKNIKGQLCASHHQYDEETDEFVNFMVTLGPLPSFQSFTIGPYLPKLSIKTQEITTTLHEPIWRHLGAWKTLEPLKPSYIHSFSMTKRYIIIPNFPYYYSFGGLSALYYSSAYQTFYWEENRHTLFHVIDRNSGRHIATYEADPCFSFHTANAWDEDIPSFDGKTETVIYFDMSVYENTDIVDASFEFGKGTESFDAEKVKPAPFVIKKKACGKANNKIAPCQVRRYRLTSVPAVDESNRVNKGLFGISTDFNARKVASYNVLGYDLELPRFNQNYALKPYRYLWGVCQSKYAPSYASGAVVNGIIKLDLHNPTADNSTAVYWDEPGCSCAEPIFVPSDDRKSEDDGVVISIVNASLPEGDSCFLLILDAATLKELARTTMGLWHTTTIHGSFVDQTGRGTAVN
ncbi:carotene dioxygenase [Umbelopsis sp. PMI_123]|nr:carotene dioxygenase [Umbelopsis sp. PMI_123]